MPSLKVLVIAALVALTFGAQDPAKPYVNQLFLEASTENRLYLAYSSGDVQINAGQGFVDLLVFLEYYPEITTSGLVARRPPQSHLPTYWVLLYPGAMIWYDTVQRDYYTRANTYTIYSLAPGSTIKANGPGVLRIVSGYGQVSVNGVKEDYSAGYVRRF